MFLIVSSLVRWPRGGHGSGHVLLVASKLLTILRASVVHKQTDRVIDSRQMCKVRHTMIGIPQSTCGIASGLSIVTIITS